MRFLHENENSLLLWPYQGDVAQLVEQRTENPCVGGSIPSITTSKSLQPEAFFAFNPRVGLLIVRNYSVFLYYFTLLLLET